MKSLVNEKQFKEAAKILLPEFIEICDHYYRLDAHGLMGGSWRILYVNGHYEENYRITLDEIWDDPFDCLKAMDHSINMCFHQVISKDEFNKSIPKDFRYDKKG